jgi:hypothetical protein
MRDLVAWLLLTMSIIGGLYAIGLIISYFILPRDFNDLDIEDSINCDCYRCERR